MTDKDILAQYAADVDALLSKGASRNLVEKVTKLSADARKKLAGDSAKSILGILATTADNVAEHPEAYASWEEAARTYGGLGTGGVTSGNE